MVCWDCDGIVVEETSLESHYTESPAHPSCVVCGLGKKNSADMDEVCDYRVIDTCLTPSPQHVKDVHAMEIEDQPQGDDVTVSA